MLTCAHCQYQTSRSYNLKRHTLLKHYDVVNIELNETSLNENSPNVINNSPNIHSNSPNIHSNSPNIHSNSPNIHSNSPNVHFFSQNIKDDLDTNNNTYNCKDCYKTFINKYTLKKHESCCKKIKESFECNHCHHIYSSSQSLYNHKKRCKNVSLIVPDETTNTSPLINNSSINNSAINSHNTNNIQNNITLNVFPTDISSPFTLYTDHIDAAKLRKDIEIQPLYQAAAMSLRLLLENKHNLPVRKKNMRCNYSYVHVGNDKWTIRNDTEVYALLCYHISKYFKIYLGKKNVMRLERYYKYLHSIFENIVYESSNEDAKDLVEKAKFIMDVIMMEAYEKNLEQN